MEIQEVRKRYVALDIHKRYCIIAGVDREGQILLSSNHVVIESTTNAWHVYDLLAPLVERVVGANPIKVKQIATARVKTDVRDTLILARMLAANMIPAIWVPPTHVRNLRYPLSQRRHLMGCIPRRLIACTALLIVIT